MTCGQVTGEVASTAEHKITNQQRKILKNFLGLLGLIWGHKMHLKWLNTFYTKLDYATSTFIQYTAKYSDYIESTLRFVGIYEFFNIANSNTVTYTCRLLPSWCKYTREFLLTSNPKLDDEQRFKVYTGHYPGGGSIQSLVQFG